MKEKDVKLSYLAGIVDGEGTIAVTKQSERWYQIRLHVKNTSEPLMDYLKANYAGKKIGPYNHKQENGKDVFRWQCDGQEAIKLIEQIEQYLIVKQPQAELALDAWSDTFKINYHNRGMPNFAIEKREYYYHEMKKLNMRGKQENEEEEPMVHKSRYVITFDKYEVERETVVENEDTIREENNYNSKNNESELSYFAAIVDGEGTIRIKRNKRKYNIVLSVKNTSKELIDYLKKNFKGNNGGPYEDKRGNRKDYFVWECMHKEAIKLIRKIETYLVIKQQQAKLALKAWEDTFKDDYRGREMPKYIIDTREQYYQQMKKLNQRGKQEDEQEENENEEIEITLKINKNALRKWLESE